MRFVRNFGILGLGIVFGASLVLAKVDSSEQDALDQAQEAIAQIQDALSALPEVVLASHRPAEPTLDSARAETKDTQSDSASGPRAELSADMKQS